MATHTFVSKASNFRLVVEPILPVFLANGKTTTKGGTTVEFRRGVFQTTDDTLATKIRDAGTFNREFFEKGNEPGALHPPTQELLDRILTAAMRGQADKIKEILALERDTHQREEVLKQGELALGELTDGREGRRAPGRRPGQPQAA